MAYWNSKDKMIEKKDPTNESSEESISENDLEDTFNINEEEINSLNNQLDQLNHALDRIEQKNDDLHAQLVELLEVNKQAREHFLQIKVQNCDLDDKKTDTT